MVLLLLTYKEWPKRPVTFETFDQSDEETWPDQKKTSYDKGGVGGIGAVKILYTPYLSHTDYIFDNWEHLEQVLICFMGVKNIE